KLTIQQLALVNLLDNQISDILIEWQDVKKLNGLFFDRLMIFAHIKMRYGVDTSSAVLDSDKLLTWELPNEHKLFSIGERDGSLTSSVQFTAFFDDTTGFALFKLLDDLFGNDHWLKVFFRNADDELADTLDDIAVVDEVFVEIIKTQKTLDRWIN
ncbi:MAG: hypothetical protein ACTSYA_01050, partial [Candidatus Kariarchaeaceae archaeon]